MLIKNLTIETMAAADAVCGGWILFENDRIISVGTGEPPVYDGEVLDGTGLTALPGFVDAHTHLGIVEDSLDFEGDDCNEDSDPATPQLRALDGVNPFDRCFTEARAAGVTTVAVAPGSANPIGGQICVIKTAGNDVDGMSVLPYAAMKFALGENPKNTYHAKNASPVTRMATAAIIRETLAKAKRYLDELDRSEREEDYDPPEFDFRNESLIPLLRGDAYAHFHAHRADDISTALRISKEFGLKPVIVHGTEGHLISSRLTGISVIAGPNLCDRCKPELRNQTFVNPAVLSECGALVALTTDHPVTPLNYLTLCAGLARNSGLDRRRALEAITVNPAKILGLDSRIGTIEPGKDADIVLVRGDVLSLESKIEAVFINGVKVN